MRTRAQIDKARDDAMITLLLAIKGIAEKHRVCPICLSYAATETIERALKEGEIEHVPDEYEEADIETAGMTVQ